MRASRTLLALVGLALATSVARAQGVIETAAGGGPGDGSPALAVNLRTPQDAIRDAAGNTYVAVSDDRRVYKIATDGTIALVAGSGGSGSWGDGGPAVKAELVSPKGLAFDSDGSLLIADEGGRRVRRVDLASGTISTLIGGGGLTGEGIGALQILLDAPRDVVVAAGGNVLVADGNRVRQLDRATGLVSTVAGTGVAGFLDGTPGRLSEPRGLALDPAGNLLIADGGNGRIRKLTFSTGALSTVVTGICSPGGVAADAAGVVYFSSNTGSCGGNAQKYLKFVSGSVSTIGSTGSSYVAQVTALPGGSLLVADRDNYRIKTVSSSGVVTILAGNGTIGYYGNGVPALSASMLSPTHVRANSAGNIYFFDNTNQIRRVTPAGLEVTLASAANCGSDPNSSLCAVEGLAILASGAVVFSSSKDDKLHKVDPATGVVSDLTSALGRPRGIASSASGFVFVADRGAGNNNGTIQKVDPTTGVVTMVASGLPRPQYIAVDGSNNVYFTSLNGSSIQNIPSAGGAAVTYATLTSAVTGLDVDASGNLYASDSNDQVWKIAAATGAKSVYAGSGVAGLGDGGPATAARLSGPSGLSSVGTDLYIADALHYRIRRVRSNRGPVAAAGADQVVEATSPAGATVALDGTGSSDPDGDPLTYSWTGPFGSASGSSPSVVLPLGTHSITLQVSDGGVSASDTLSVTVQDTIGPVITYERSPEPNANGWNNTDVTVTFTCTDSGSGLTVLPATSHTVAVEGAGQSRSHHCTDAAGNESTLVVSNINVDKTAPVSTASVSPSANAHGWNSTDVTVSFAATDGLSGVASCDPAVVLSGEAAGQSASGSCTDQAGNSAAASASGINIDKTAPSLSFGGPSPAANVHGWNNTDVAFVFTPSDGLSGVDSTSIPSPLVLSGEGPAISDTVSVTDLAGNTASFPSPVVKIDRTSPVVEGSRAPLANSYGWNNTDVTVSVSATDALSGVDSCDPDVVVSTEGAGQSVTRSCTDLAGNAASATVDSIHIDKTAPESGATASPSANAHGWNNTDVTVTFAATDALSGEASCAPAVVLSDEGSGQSASGSCTDLAGNSAEASASGINIDKTAPSLSFDGPSPAANANGWNNSDVAFAFTTSDSLSGVDSASIASPLVLTGEGTSVSGTVDVTDLAGNTANFSSPVVNIDRTSPVVVGSRAPLANSYGWNNTDVTVSVSATDALSGVESCEPDVVVSTEGAAQSVSRSCTDLAGNSASATVENIQIDKTAPDSGATAAPSANVHGWNNTDVTVTFAATDGLSGVASCDPAVVLSDESAGQSASGSCTDLAGNSASASASGINIDKTAPSLSFGEANPAPNASGWNNSDVAFPFAASDSLSGIDSTSIPSPLVLTSEGASVSGTVSVTDLAGNTRSFPSPIVKIDRTSPVVTGSRAPLANAYGWNNTNVTVSVSATDALSGVESCEPDVVVSTEGAAQSVTRSCTDLAGNSGSATVASIHIDKTAPSVTGTPSRPADRNGWFNHAVSVAWSGTDALSGVLSCSSASAYAGPDAVSVSLSGHCSDRAGNDGAGSHALKFDATAPVVSLVTPPNGATYSLNQSVMAQYSCTDNLAGVESCAGPVANGAAISTSPVGAKSFKVDAMDAAGNTAAVTSSYAIQYRFSGFLQPVDNLPVVNAANAGRTIPVKWQLKDAAGVSVSDLSAVTSLLWAPMACDAAPTDIIEEETAATGGTVLRYDGSQFIYNWSTQKSWANTCVQIQLTLADGTKQYAKFKFK